MLDNIIDSCKSVIEVRARWMGLDFEIEDIQHQTLPGGHTIVALMFVHVPKIVDEESCVETAEYKHAKVPLIRLEWPTGPPQRSQYSQYESKLNAWLPKIHIQFPQLIMIILPDGSVKKSDDPQILEGIACREMRQITLNSPLGPTIAEIAEKCKSASWKLVEK